LPFFDADRFLEIGVIGRPHGVHGLVRVLLHNPSSNLISQVKYVTVVSNDKATVEKYEIAKISVSGKYTNLGLKEIRSREGADLLKGHRLFVHKNNLPKPDEDEFYVEDLIGLETREGEKVLGRIKSSREQGGIEVITVENENEEIEIPLIESYVEKLNFEQKTLWVKDVEFLPKNKKSHKRKK